MPSPPSAPSAGTELTAGPWGHGGICASRRDDGLMVLVSGAIPGERVRVEVTEQRRTYARGSVIEVLEAAPSRVRPPWPEGAALGVTDLGHVAPISARQAKGEVVTGLLAQIGGIAWPVEVEPVGTGAALGWRTKIELTVAADGRAGMYSRRSETLVPLAAMPLAVPELAALGLFERRWPVGSRLTAVAPSAGTPFCLVDGSPADRVRREAVCVRGQTFTYELPGAGFWQLHRDAPPVLVEAVCAAVAPGPVSSANGALAGSLAGMRIWDLYAGAGLFTLPLAAAQAQVTAVESSVRAASALRANARHAGLRLGGAHAADVGAALRRGIGGGQPDAVVVDPPRAGLAKGVAEALVAVRPNKLVYVSCDPATLARDLGALRGAGYELSGLRAFDLFPGTHHVETVAVLVAPGANVIT